MTTSTYLHDYCLDLELLAPPFSNGVPVLAAQAQPIPEGAGEKVP